MKHMFSNCIYLTYLDLFNFNTININNMSYMFSIISEEVKTKKIDTYSSNRVNYR